MQLLVKGTRRIIFILCAVVLNALFTRTAINLQKSAKSMSSPLKLATLQTSLKHVRRSAHNADFRRLSISKHPANAHKINIIRRVPPPLFTIAFSLPFHYNNNQSNNSNFQERTPQNEETQHDQRTSIPDRPPMHHSPYLLQ